MQGAGHATPRGSRSPLLVTGVALAIRLWQPGPTIVTADEIGWSSRSISFGQALAQGDLAAATTGPLDQRLTRPGITTMWAGHLGAVLTRGDLPWLGSRDALANGHALVSVLCALGLWGFIVAAGRVVGRRAALVAGGLLAVEPFLVGHSAVLHTDALVTMYTATAIVAVAATVVIAREEAVGPALVRFRRSPSVRYAVLAGAASAMALLSKVSAAALLGPALVAFVALGAASVHRDETQSQRVWWGRMVRSFCVLTATATIVMFAAWPALWIDPVGNLRAVVDSGRLAGDAPERFFLGSVSTEGDLRFYPVVALLRTSAWLLVLGTLSAGWIIGRRIRGIDRQMPRSVSWALAAPVVAYALIISTSDKQYDRYYLPLLPFTALCVGTVVIQVVDSLPSRASVRTRPLGWVTFALTAGWTLTLAPYSIAHVNPLAGGQAAAVDRIPLGWGEGKEWVPSALEGLDPGRCPDLVAHTLLIYSCRDIEWFDGEPPPTGALARDILLHGGLGWPDGAAPPPDYVVLYIFDRQLGRTAQDEAALARNGRRVATLALGATNYVEIWDPAPGG